MMKLNLLIKHWPSKDDKEYSVIYKNIQTMNNISKKIIKMFIYIHRETNIFLYLFFL